MKETRSELGYLLKSNILISILTHTKMNCTDRVWVWKTFVVDVSCTHVDI